MKELIDRLEKLTAPSREEDYQIAASIGLNAFKRQRWDQGSFVEYGIVPKSFGTPNDLPLYTRSVDAALTLVPERWTRAVDATAPEMGIDVDLFPDAGYVRGTHNSEAIATCIAALKARSADLGRGQA